MGQRIATVRRSHGDFQGNVMNDLPPDRARGTSRYPASPTMGELAGLFRANVLAPLRGFPMRTALAEAGSVHAPHRALGNTKTPCRNAAIVPAGKVLHHLSRQSAAIRSALAKRGMPDKPSCVEAALTTSAQHYADVEKADQPLLSPGEGWNEDI